MKNKYFCVHGHFYQPPRENPWLDAIEGEESANPYPDWNEKIFQECYGPNSACPILDENGLIVAMDNNYRRMSFNFGPTLLRWLEREHPATYQAIIKADKESCEEFDGHGNAIAQPYYHAILPLQNERDKRTLVRWGMDDFRKRFGREPEGMWLPETAVDAETLEVLIDEGVAFTILAPSQAARVRDLGAQDWKEVTEENLLPTRPYRWISRKDPSRHIAIFFYHRLLHESVDSGEAFKSDDALCHKALARVLPDDSTQLISVATDGEFYGHHRRTGAAALAQTFRLAPDLGLSLTNYAHYLSLFPPPQEVELHENTAWSCPHGLGRWNADCGCRYKKGTSQGWRGPLREALNWLAGEIDTLYAAQAGIYFKDFLAARDAYAQKLSDSSAQSSEKFLKAHSLGELTEERRRQAMILLEMQRSRLAMFTSCGWFFDDLSGIETTLILKHAARAIELAEVFEAKLTDGFKERLAKVPGPSQKLSDGAKVYAALAEPGRGLLARAAAHFALLDHVGMPAASAGRAFSAKHLSSGRKERQELAGSDRSLSWSYWEVEDRLTNDSTKALAVVHQQDRVDLRCYIGRWPGADKAGEELARLFETLSREELERELSKRFDGVHFGLDALFARSRLDVMRRLMPAPLESVELAAFRKDWTAAIAALKIAPVSDEVLDLLARARGLKSPPDQLPWIGDVRARFMGILESLIVQASPERLSRAARWIDAFEQHGLHADVWELQQFFWRWREKILAAETFGFEREAARAFGEKLRFSSAVLADRDPQTA